MVNYKQQKALMDENLRYSTDEDFNYISERIFIRNVFKVVSILVQFIFTVYLVGNFWIVMVLLTYGPDDEEEVNFLNNSPDWNFRELSDTNFVINLLYYIFTSLSTVGFGDFYPITDGERIITSVMLLSGVATFSYTLGLMESCIID